MGLLLVELLLILVSSTGWLMLINILDFALLMILITELHMLRDLVRKALSSQRLLFSLCETLEVSSLHSTLSTLTLDLNLYMSECQSMLRTDRLLLSSLLLTRRLLLLVTLVLRQTSTTREPRNIFQMVDVVLFPSSSKAERMPLLYS